MINAQIPLGVQPVQFQMPDPNAGMNALAKAMQIKSLMQEGEVNALKMDELRRGVERKNKLYEIAGGTYEKPEQREEALYRGGFFDEAAKLSKDRREALKADADTEKTKLETGIKQYEHVGSVLSMAKDPASYATVRAVIKQSFGQDLPEQFDPGFVQALIARGQTRTQQLAAEHQRLTLAETQRHNQASEGIQVRGQNMTAETARRGQNMTDARAREANDINRQAGRTQVVETPEGIMLVDKGAGQARPATANGKPLAGKPSAATEKELVGLRQQKSIVDGAIAAVDKTPSAFGLGRGMATMAGPIPESLAGRLDSDAERQARSYVFNNVSKVINERAGAAQSAQELARLRSFLPAETDNAQQIKSKLLAFNTYLADMESGTKGASKPQGGASGGWSIQKVN